MSVFIEGPVNREQIQGKSCNNAASIVANYHLSSKWWVILAFIGKQKVKITEAWCVKWNEQNKYVMLTCLWWMCMWYVQSSSSYFPWIKERNRYVKVHKYLKYTTSNNTNGFRYEGDFSSRIWMLKKMSLSIKRHEFWRCKKIQLTAVSCLTSGGTFCTRFTTTAAKLLSGNLGFDLPTSCLWWRWSYLFFQQLNYSFISHLCHHVHPKVSINRGINCLPLGRFGHIKYGPNTHWNNLPICQLISTKLKKYLPFIQKLVMSHHI